MSNPEPRAPSPEPRAPNPASPGLLIVFEGLDQSGKQTQAALLGDRLVGAGRLVRLLSFPTYETALGAEIEQALQGARDYGAEVMQLLYVANRYEWKPEIERERATGTIVVCDRYVASAIAYGEAQGLDAVWLGDVQRHLPQPDVTVLLDIAPEVSARRKTNDRDKSERDLALLGRVRASYLRQAAAGAWTTIDAARDREHVAVDVYDAVRARL